MNTIRNIYNKCKLYVTEWYKNSFLAEEYTPVVKPKTKPKTKPRAKANAKSKKTTTKS
jgi:hypothetical protein|tara:strand:+ start:1418 stop:1591 length:174 start_codon:yes stop_codon:yes gene_type:complete